MEFNSTFKGLSNFYSPDIGNIKDRELTFMTHNLKKGIHYNVSHRHFFSSFGPPPTKLLTTAVKYLTNEHFVLAGYICFLVCGTVPAIF